MGDPAVGKTSLVQRYVYDKFDERYLSTIGTKPSVKVIDHNGTEVTLTIWDIAGQETFQNMHSSYFKGAAGAILVCDILRPGTVESLAHWSHRFHQTSPNGQMVLVSNKWDIVENEASVLSTEKEVITFSKENGCVYLKASAKENRNVEEIFVTLVGKIMV